MSNVNTILFIGTLSNALLKSKQNSPIIKATKKLVNDLSASDKANSSSNIFTILYTSQFWWVRPFYALLQTALAYSCFLLNIIN